MPRTTAASPTAQYGPGPEGAAARCLSVAETDSEALDSAAVADARRTALAEGTAIVPAQVVGREADCSLAVKTCLLVEMVWVKRMEGCSVKL